MKVRRKYNPLKKAGFVGLFVLLCFTTKAQNIHYLLKLSFQNDRISSYSEELSRLQIGADTTGFLDRSGKLLFTVPPFPYCDGVCIIQIRGQESDNSDGYILLKNRQGEQVSQIPFKTKYGLMYDANHTYHEGLVGIQVFTEEDGLKWGYIDKQGHFVIPPIYDLALNFQDDHAMVKTRNGRVNYLINPLKEKNK